MHGRATRATAVQFATGYHRNYIGQLERGEKSPSLKALFDFAESFQLEPSDLLKKVEGSLQRDSVRQAHGIVQTRLSSGIDRLWPSA
jgi:transcriptional regulator with XRE-family HTH domain